MDRNFTIIHDAYGISGFKGVRLQGEADTVTVHASFPHQWDEPLPDMVGGWFFHGGHRINGRIILGPRDAVFIPNRRVAVQAAEHAAKLQKLLHRPE